MIIEAIQSILAAVVGYFGKKAVVNAAEVVAAEIPTAIATAEAKKKMSR